MPPPSICATPGNHDAVIVGAGPTGLALAAELHRLGIAPLVLDRLNAGENTSRAAVIHARTLEVLQPLGVNEQLLGEGLALTTFRLRDRSRILASVDFGDLDTAFPFTLMCPQDRTEAILLERLRTLGGAVRRRCTVLAVRPRDGDVELECATPNGSELLRARWVIGCDGAHSIVRTDSGIPFDGGDYTETFLLADVQMQWSVPRDEVSLFFSDNGLMVVAPLPHDRFRVVATVAGDMAAPRDDDVRRLLQERGPAEAQPVIRRCLWTSRFHLQHRIARQMRQGPVLIAGDAAHVHSPAGGQGMNTGIQDAVSLAGVLRSVLLGGDQAALDEWQTRRRDIARSVVALTDRMTRLATVSSPRMQAVRNLAVQLIGHVPPALHAIAHRLAELDNR